MVYPLSEILETPLLVRTRKELMGVPAKIDVKGGYEIDSFCMAGFAIHHEEQELFVSCGCSG
jgi:hypothetical protein